MRSGADALRRVVELARIGLGVSDQILHRFGRKVGPHQQHVRDVRHDRDWLELGRVVVESLDEQRIGGDRRRLRGEQGVAIGRRMIDHVGGKTAAGAGLVFDRHRLAQYCPHLVGDDPGKGVDTAARRGGDNDPDRMVGKIRSALRTQDRRRQRRGRRSMRLRNIWKWRDRTSDGTPKMAAYLPQPMT